MRITEARMLEVGSVQTMRAQERVAAKQAELSSGKRVERPSQDPTAWAEGRRAQVRSQASSHRGQHLARSNERLADTERVLESLGEVTARARELAIQGANATLDADNRAGIASEIRQLRAAALDAVNTRDAEGEYLFAGSRGDVAPFDAAGVYVGDDLQREVESGEGAMATATLPGSRLTAASGIDLFARLDALATALEAGDEAAIAVGVGDMDEAVRQVSRARTETGEMMRAFDLADDARQGLELALAATEVRSLETDAIGAATELAQAMNTLEASRAVTSRIIEITRPRL